MNPIVEKSIIERKTTLVGSMFPAALSWLGAGTADLRLFGLFGRGDLDCGEVRDLASDYLDDEVDRSVRSKIASHLGKCSVCTAFVETLRATVSLLGSFERQQAPPSLRGYVHDRIRRETGA